jgi:hypothetical protein
MATARQNARSFHTDGQRRPIAQIPLHGVVQFEPQKVHRGGLVLVLAFEIFVGDRVHPGVPGNLDPGLVLDPLQLGEADAPLFDIRVFKKHRCLPVAPIRNQRVVGVEFTLDTLLLEDLLDAEHLLDLVAKRQFVLEDQRQVGTDLHLAMLLVLEHARAEFRAGACVGLQGHQAVTGDCLHGFHGREVVDYVVSRMESESVRDPDQ